LKLLIIFYLIKFNKNNNLIIDINEYNNIQIEITNIDDKIKNFKSDIEYILTLVKDGIKNNLNNLNDKQSQILLIILSFAQFFDSIINHKNLEKIKTFIRNKEDDIINKESENQDTNILNKVCLKDIKLNIANKDTEIYRIYKNIYNLLETKKFVDLDISFN